MNIIDWKIIKKRKEKKTDSSTLHYVYHTKEQIMCPSDVECIFNLHLLIALTTTTKNEKKMNSKDFK